VTGAVFALSAAAPGPDTMLLFGRATAGGPQAAIPVAVGITLGKLLLLSLAALGVTAIGFLGPLFLAIKFFGALYLVWLGIRLIKTKRPSAPTADSPRTSAAAATATGFGLAITNPQAILFYVAILPSVIGTGGVPLLAALAATLCLVMSVVAAGWIAIGTRAGAAKASRPWMNRLIGGLIVGAGVLVAAR